MYCDKCGSQLPENAKFCGNCGNPIQNNMMILPVTLPSPKRGKIIPVAAVVVILILCAIVFWAYGANTLKRADKLAQKGKYEKALELYDGILEKEPLNLKANLGKLYVYSNMKKNSSLYQTYQRALTIIRQMEPEETAKHGETICQIYLYAGEVYQHNNENRNAALIEGMQYLERDMGCSDQYLEKLREIVQELYDGQQREELIKVCETLIKLEPEQIQYQDMAVLASQGQFKILVVHKEFEKAEALLERYESHMSEITVNNLRNMMDKKKEELPIKVKRQIGDWFEASEKEEFYDRCGFLTKDTWTCLPVSSVSTYTYDDFGNFLREKSGDNITNYVNTYDLAGNLLEKKTDTNYTCLYEYDQNGNLLKETNTNENVTFITQNEYNADGRLIKTEMADEQGNLQQRYLYEYWENGNIKKATYEDGSGYVDTIEYWENGNIKKDSNSKGRVEIYYYDEKERLVESDIFVYGALSSNIQYQYDEEDKIVLVNRVIYDEDIYRDVYEYEYDEEGRSILEKLYRNGVLRIQFEYEYY